MQISRLPLRMGWSLEIISFRSIQLILTLSGACEHRPPCGSWLLCSVPSDIARNRSMTSFLPSSTLMPWVLSSGQGQCWVQRGGGRGLWEIKKTRALEWESSSSTTNNRNMSKSLLSTVNRSPLKWLSRFHQSKGEANPSWESEMVAQGHILQDQRTEQIREGSFITPIHFLLYHPSPGLRGWPF